jgi:hypothetical protein
MQLGAVTQTEQNRECPPHDSASEKAKPSFRNGRSFVRCGRRLTDRSRPFAAQGPPLRIHALAWIAHGSRTGTELAVELSGPGAAPIHRLSPSVVNSTGMLTFETVPGLNLHVRRVLRTELSKSGLPVLCCMEALVTRPLARSTNTRQTPLPAMRRERASCG